MPKRQQREEPCPVCQHYHDVSPRWTPTPRLLGASQVHCLEPLCSPPGPLGEGWSRLGRAILFGCPFL